MAPVSQVDDPMWHLLYKQHITNLEIHANNVRLLASTTSSQSGAPYEELQSIQQRADNAVKDARRALALHSKTTTTAANHALPANNAPAAIATQKLEGLRQQQNPKNKRQVDHHLENEGSGNHKQKKRRGSGGISLPSVAQTDKAVAHEAVRRIKETKQVRAADASKASGDGFDSGENEAGLGKKQKKRKRRSSGDDNTVSLTDAGSAMKAKKMKKAAKKSDDV